LDDFKNGHFRFVLVVMVRPQAFHIPADFLVAESGDSIPRSETVNNVVKMTLLQRFFVFLSLATSF
jgi:hypothetical protein